jgi:hypothetical protein
MIQSWKRIDSSLDLQNVGVHVATPVNRFHPWSSVIMEGPTPPMNPINFSANLRYNRFSGKSSQMPSSRHRHIPIHVSKSLCTFCVCADGQLITLYSHTAIAVSGWRELAYLKVDHASDATNQCECVIIIVRHRHSFWVKKTMPVCLLLTMPNDKRMIRHFSSSMGDKINA